MFDQQDEIKNKKGPLSVLNLTGASQFFYQKSNFITAILATVIFIGYLLLVMMDKGAGFEVADSNIRSLGTSFGFDQVDVIAFLSIRSDEMVTAYITFNQVWDVLFGVIYGVMYVVWVSVLFKPICDKVGRLNLVPVLQVIFDWLENYELVLLAHQYLSDGMISASNANLASVFSMLKWACSGLTYTLISIGIILMIMRAVANKNQQT
ncbi:MAG: hypothetical protein HON39_00730 [Marinovum sp.]|nr:hypothetical protein [Marinovum sp.]